MRLVSSASRAFDTAVGSSVSFRPLRSVGPGIPSDEPLFASRPDEAVVNEFPISRAKVTPPPVRDETLSRERLLAWLDSAVLRKVVFVVAEAGYGKTTLLADFSRRTRVRCLWFKLDAPDGDWVTFLHYLVAAGREAVPDFAPATSELLGQTGESIKEAAIQTFASELEQLADRPTAFIFDDYHLVEGQPEVARIVQRMIRFLPERMSLILLSRRRPTLRVARLHALDEVRELERDDLRFSRDETERLFSEAYKQPLEADVLDVVDSRTEGWAASLQLLWSGLRGRSPIEVRAFVGRMSATEGHLYEYLAEEVIGDLPESLRRFLVRTSVLDKVTPELARAALSVDVEMTPTLHEIRALIQSGESIGLLSRRGESSRWSHRYHPLIQEYLHARLSEELTSDEIRELHRTIAREAEPTSWAVAAHHRLQAGDASEVVATIERQISAIASSGQYSLAADFLDKAKVEVSGPVPALVRARIDMFAGRMRRPREYLDAAIAQPEALGPEALQLLISMASSLGDIDAASALANVLLQHEDVGEWGTAIAKATIALRDSALTGSLELALEATEEAALLHERQQRWHLAGISRYNVADLWYVCGGYEDAAADVTKSIDYLKRSGGDAAELGPAFALLGSVMVTVGRWEEAAKAFNRAESGAQTALYKFEVSIRRAQYLADIGKLEKALLLARETVALAGTSPPLNVLAMIATAGADIGARCYDLEFADRCLRRFDGARATTEAAAVAHHKLARARLAVLQHNGSALSDADDALAHAGSQGAWHLAWSASLIRAAAADSGQAIAEAVSESVHAAPGIVMSEAAVLCGALHVLDPIPPELENLFEARPEAWRPHWRHRLGDELPDVRLANARLLDRYGEWEDVRRVRQIAKHPSTRRSGGRLGVDLARRTAPRIFVHDLGRTVLEVGDRTIEASGMRRKVGALVAYLLTRPGYAATREQALEALWPDAPLEVGTNSLHQTIYFLRRELEPDYSEDASPRYVRLEGELVWLDPALVDSASRQFAALTRSDSPSAALEAIRLYRGRFSPEFEYEDWAISTRDALHAAYLELVERTLRDCSADGRWAVGAEIARLALAVDPSAEAIEKNLISLYHHSGSHAAAAEQYAHFVAAQRAEYGVEPPPFGSVVDRT
jgi:ATP/maltotriose-dependent transcriptional regulator MalT/DNA-binding SARP family transcriptional activator